MVKILGFAFALLLACAHMADAQGDAYYRPLSMFRDYEPMWIGYALFGVLMAIGLATTRTAFRVHNEVQAAFYIVVTLLLGVVAATPSNDSWHDACALYAMAAMLINYAVLLYLKHSMFWLVMHLLTPSFFMWATQLESYGIWQKCMILYFVTAAVVHEGDLAQWLPRRKRVKRKRVKVQVRVGLRQTHTTGSSDCYS